MNDRFVHITSSSNPLIKNTITLHRSADRREHGVFIAEKAELIFSALDHGWEVVHLFVTEDWYDSNRSKISKAEKQGAKIYSVTQELFKKLSTANSPEPCLAVIRNQTPKAIPESPTLGVALHELRDPGNLGTLVRSAVATDADFVACSPRSVDTTHPKVLRSTAGLWFAKPPVEIDFEAAIPQWQQHGMQVLGASAEGTTYWECDLTKPTVFLLGNEGMGLPSKIKKRCDLLISVPMHRNVESLNVAMTGTLLLYEAKRQRVN
jgi:RNA methyltransferase, TrmH family